MGCAHPYDWSVQSASHGQYFRANYPTMEMIAAEAEANPGDAGINFDKIVDTLDAGTRADYLAEKNLWWDQFGHSWDSIGCVHESYAGEHTAGIGWEAKDTIPGSNEVMDIQKKLKAAGFEPGPVDGKWGKKTCAACYGFNKQVRKSYEMELTKDFFRDLGFGYASSEAMASRYGTKCAPYYAQFGTVLTASDIQAVQQQLRSKGYVTTVDGILGSETCRNLYAAQAKLGVQSCGIAKETFYSLGFDELTSGMYASLFSDPCKGYCPGFVAPQPKPEPKPEPKVEPKIEPVVVTEPVKKKFPWWLVGTIVGIGAIGMIAMKDDKKGKK